MRPLNELVFFSNTSAFAPPPPPAAPDVSNNVVGPCSSRTSVTSMSRRPRVSRCFKNSSRFGRAQCAARACSSSSSEQAPGVRGGEGK